MNLHGELIFLWKVSHLDSFWNRGTRLLGIGLFGCRTTIAKYYHRKFILSCRRLKVVFYYEFSLVDNTIHHSSVVTTVSDSSFELLMENRSYICNFFYQNFLTEYCWAQK